METPTEPNISRGKPFADFFALKRNLVIILIAIFIIGSGEELWMRFVPKYLQTLGASVFVIGLYDALRTLISAIYAYPGGLWPIAGATGAPSSLSTSSRSPVMHWSS